jgi:hypothetical protein
LMPFQATFHLSNRCLYGILGSSRRIFCVSSY